MAPARIEMGEPQSGRKKFRLLTLCVWATQH